VQQETVYHNLQNLLQTFSAKVLQLERHAAFSYICVDGAVRMILGAVPSARPPMCRLYIEQYSADTSTHKQDAQEALSKIIKVALDVSQLTKFTSREKPTVIT